jgi:DNA-binding Xre family transcriptional regulator
MTDNSSENIRNNKTTYRLYQLMRAQRFNMTSLSIAAGLNTTAVRDILRGRVKSPKYSTLEKLALALCCNVNDIIGRTIDPEIKKGLLRIKDIDIELFAEAVTEVDLSILSGKRIISIRERALQYLQAYNQKLD